MPDYDVVAIDPTARAVANHYSGVGTINLGIAVRPVTGDLYVTNTNSRNLIRFVTNLRGHWVDNRITQIQRTSGVVTAYDLNPGIDYSVLPNPPALSSSPPEITCGLRALAPIVSRR